jgi:hypothetical protein
VARSNQPKLAGSVRYESAWFRRAGEDLATPAPEAEIPISARYDSDGLDLYHCWGEKTRVSSVELLTETRA